MNMCLVKKGSYVEIQMLKEILEENNINCLVKSEHGEGFVLSTGGYLEEYTLYVNEDDVVLANSLSDSFIGGE